MQRQSKTYNIRLQVTVEVGSLEEFVLEYLNDEEARPFGKAQMLMTAIKPFWSSLALLNKKLPLERVVQALRDGRYLWELHEQYLRERIGELKLGLPEIQTRENREDTNLVSSPNPKSKAQKDLEQEVRTDPTFSKGHVKDLNGVSLISEEAKPVVASVVEDLPAAYERSKKPFNPFGESIVIKS